VTRPPEFRDLVGDDLSPAERERLAHVHDLLVAAGPPPELPLDLAEPPRTGGTLVQLARHRLRTGLVLAAAVVLTTFAVGYFLGARGEDPGSAARFALEKRAVLGTVGDRYAVVRIGERDGSGNRQMLVTVEGLDRLTGGDYYTLFMTQEGKPTVVCGTFNVNDEGATTVRFNVAYDLAGFDGLLLAHYRHDTHDSKPLLRAPLT
jgi:hypothetical protein